MLSRDDVLRARERVGDRLHRTPTFSSRTLGPHVFLKAELFQKTGSFKPRGVLNKLATLSPEERARGAITFSAGNHAQAVAWGCAGAGVDSLVVMWAGASAQKVAATRAYGAAVDTEATGPAEAFERLQELQAASGRVFISPWDDPVVIAGQGTVGLEVEEDVPGIDTIVAGAGGGGLVAGIAAAVDCRVVAVEPAGSQALRAGLAAGAPVPVPTATIADALAPPFAGAAAIEICRARGVESVLVSDEEISEAMRFLYTRAKLACEPGAAAAVAALLAGRIEGERICCVVSGGNVSAATAAAILAGR